MSLTHDTKRSQSVADKEEEGMATAPVTSYTEAARRHLLDAEMLFAGDRKANAGQLYGFVAECGVKALLIACGVPTDADGGIAKNPLRAHVPVLMDRVVAHGALIPDGLLSNRYMAMIGSAARLSDWSVDHRYYRESALPLLSLPAWRTAAHDVGKMLDQAKQDGVL